MGALGPEQRKEPRYKVAYHTYLASGRRLSYTLSVERVVDCKYVKRSLLVRQIFATCRLRHAHVRKDTRLSPLYRTESDGKLGGAWERGYNISCTYNSLASYLALLSSFPAHAFIFHFSFPLLEQPCDQLLFPNFGVGPGEEATRRPRAKGDLFLAPTHVTWPF